jgi:hypothetical protein
LIDIHSFSSDPSVKDLIGLYDVMGVPHFQRGLVWNAENTSLLLESLYFDTPCGTIILWEPTDPAKEGIPLSKSNTARYLIIDGQQRIRSLHDALGCNSEVLAHGLPDDDEDETSDINPKRERVWCLNLSRVPGLVDFFDAGMSRYRMFHLVTDPRREGAQIRYNLLPLDIFFKGQENAVNELIRPANGTRQQALQKMEEIKLGKQIRSLLEKKVFSLKILPEGSQLPNVVAIYNRINGAGKRVESEERAFATLVSLHSPISQWLGKVFQGVHGGKEPTRDDILKRRKERNFGFKLFIRTFIQVCAYHFGTSLGSNAFSFEVVNNLSFQIKLKNDSKVTQRLFDQTSRVVQFVRDLLRDGLKCDDLQTLPDTASLLPLFQMLIRFPKLMEPEMEKYRPALQCLALRLLLSQNLTQEKILRLVKLINHTETAKDSFEKLESKVERSADLRKKLPARLEASNALQDRYILLLYWLLRKRGARDFSYENLDEKKRMRLRPGEEVLLQEAVAPQKQHIIPYSLLAKLYNLEKRGRVSRHPCNNIGNITFISYELNHYETGLGSKPIILRPEPPNNLEAHFLGTTGDIGQMYDKAKKRVINGTAGDPKKAKRTFEDFCKRRRGLIAEALVGWVQELAPELTILERIEPEARVDPSLQDRIRAKDYPDDIEDALLELVGLRSLRFSLLRRKNISKEDLVRKVTTSSDDKGFILWFRDDNLEIQPSSSSELCRKLEGLMTGKILQGKQGVIPANWVLPTRGEAAEITTRILIEFGELLSGVNGGKE